MPIYVHFDPIFTGGVTVAGNTGWAKLHSVEFAPPRTGGKQSASGPPIGEITITKLQHAGSPGLARAGWDPVTKDKLTGKPKDPTVSIKFTRKDFTGAETTELSIRLHNVTFMKHSLSAGTAGAERVGITFHKITYTHMPSSSPDVSKAVKESLIRSGAARHHAGGIVVAMGDGSVRY